MDHGIHGMAYAQWTTGTLLELLDLEALKWCRFSNGIALIEKCQWALSLVSFKITELRSAQPCPPNKNICSIKIYLNSRNCCSRCTEYLYPNHNYITYMHRRLGVISIWWLIREIGAPFNCVLFWRTWCISMLGLPSFRLTGCRVIGMG
jgi:hypothetical protein